MHDTLSQSFVPPLHQAGDGPVAYAALQGDKKRGPPGERRIRVRGELLEVEATAAPRPWCLTLDCLLLLPSHESPMRCRQR